ncbi:hypothetical protein ACSYGO_07330 [Streptomyces krungchingensis]
MIGATPIEPPHVTVIDFLYGYALKDSSTVAQVNEYCDENMVAEMCGALRGFMGSSLAVAETMGRDVSFDICLELAEDIATAAPLHYEFAASEALRAWARGEESDASLLTDARAALHTLSICLAAVGMTLWGEDKFIALLAELQHIAKKPAAGF